MLKTTALGHEFHTDRKIIVFYTLACVVIGHCERKPRPTLLFLFLMPGDEGYRCKMVND